MTTQLHSLLQRQLRKHLDIQGELPTELLPLLSAISASYEHYEGDRKLMDRAMEISSAELMEKNQSLLQKNQMLDAFVYRVSHDLKNPITNILALSSMLAELQAESIAANPMLGRVIKNINDTAERMQVRVHDLLDLSRIEQSLAAPEEAVDVALTLQQVQKDLEIEMLAAQATISTDFEQAPKIWIAHENLYSLLSNLVGNAIKYRHPDRAAHITLETQESADGTILKISDNGLGIDLAKNGEKLYGMFNRFHSHVPGTGVGLFIIKKIIEKSGGSIAIESTVGIGTQFTIRLPHART